MSTPVIPLSIRRTHSKDREFLASRATFISYFYFYIFIYPMPVFLQRLDSAGFYEGTILSAF